MIHFNEKTLDSVQNIRLATTFNEHLNSIVEEFLYEHNDTPTRETIKAKVLNLLNEAKEQFIKEHKSFIVGEQVVPAYLLEPKVEIFYDDFDLTKLVCQFNKDAQAMVDEFYKDVN